MYHSITIGDKNTWDDWHLIPTTRPVINPPGVKTISVDVPGRDGTLDLTAALTGRPLYKNRTGTLDFYAENGFMPWHELFSEVMGYLHGQEMRAVLEDDPDYYYEGRFAVNTWKSNKDRSTLVLDYDLAPYKKRIGGLDEKWLWDTFNFRTGVIRSYRNLPVRGELKVKVMNDAMPAVPTILSTVSGITVSYAGKTYDLVRGANVISQLILQNGENELTFRGEGSVTIEMIRGRL